MVLILKPVENTGERASVQSFAVGEDRSSITTRGRESRGYKSSKLEPQRSQVQFNPQFTLFVFIFSAQLRPKFLGAMGPLRIGSQHSNLSWSIMMSNEAFLSSY